MPQQPTGELSVGFDHFVPGSRPVFPRYGGDGWPNDWRGLSTPHKGGADGIRPMRRGAWRTGPAGVAPRSSGPFGAARAKWRGVISASRRRERRGGHGGPYLPAKGGGRGN